MSTTNTDQRSLGRELAFKFLCQVQTSELTSKEKYSSSQAKESFDEYLETYQEPDDEHPQNTIDINAKALALTLIQGVLDNRDELAKSLAPSLGKRSFEKISSLEKWLLLLAAYEIRKRKKAPNKVVINEAVNLSKKYSDKDSFSFINGVLDSYSKQSD